jgi:hypothetical protein
MSPTIGGQARASKAAPKRREAALQAASRALPLLRVPQPRIMKEILGKQLGL